MTVSAASGSFSASFLQHEVVPDKRISIGIDSVEREAQQRTGGTQKVKQERLANGLTTDYGDDPRDLAKIESYDDFLKEITRLFEECGRALKSGKYMAIVVSDFRDKSRYIMFHADLSRALETVGLETLL